MKVVMSWCGCGSDDDTGGCVDGGGNEDGVGCSGDGVVIVVR